MAYFRVNHLPLLIALVLLGSSFLLLDRAAAQARDTIRKHHLDDLEHSLYFARDLHGTYPPYELPTWCGLLNNPENAAVRAQVEETLRAQNEKYANAAKPFPTDPLYATRGVDYFYWKRSPALFELYTTLEHAPTHDRTTHTCATAPDHTFDYGLTSVWREDPQVVLP